MLPNRPLPNETTCLDRGSGTGRNELPLNSPSKQPVQISQCIERRVLRSALDNSVDRFDDIAPRDAVDCAAFPARHEFAFQGVLDVTNLPLAGTVGKVLRNDRLECIRLRTLRSPRVLPPRKLLIHFTGNLTCTLQTDLSVMPNRMSDPIF